MALEIQTQRGFRFGNPKALPIEGIVNSGPLSYDITPDGKRFVVMVQKTQNLPGAGASEQINVTLNWLEELKDRVPSGR